MVKPKLLAAVLVGAAAAFLFWYPISDGDIFWHLAAGREMALTHAIPRTDPFSFTSGGAAWIDLHWLFQLGLFAMQTLFGLYGVLLANSLFLGSAAGLLFFLYAPADGLLFCASLWTASLFEVRYLAPHRPILASLFLMAAFLGCLELYGRRNRLRYLAGLVPLQILWVNAQPLFLLGPALALAWLAAEGAQALLLKGPERTAAGRRVLPLAVTLLALAVASLANPYGPKAFALAFRLFRRTDPSPDNPFSRLIDENRPLTALFGTPDAHYAWAALALTALACVLMALRPRAVRLPLACAAAGMGYLALRAERNLILYVFAVLPLIGAQLPSACASLRERMPAFRRSLGVAATLAMASLAGLAAAVHAWMWAEIRGSGPVSPFSFPDGSVAYLAAHPIEGNGFNADRYGGYLLWETDPPRKVFIDTRYAIRPDAFLAEYCALLEDPGRFGSACARYGITYAVLPTAFAPRYLGLASALLHDPDWRLMYADGTEALFYRREAAGGAGLDLGERRTVDSLYGDLRSRWASRPRLREEAEGYLARFLEEMGGGIRARSP